MNEDRATLDKHRASVGLPPISDKDWQEFVNVAGRTPLADAIDIAVGLWPANPSLKY